MPAPWVYVAIQAGLYIISHYLEEDEKEEDDERDALNRGSTTSAEEGGVVPLVFGTCRVRNPNIILWGGTGSIKEYVASTERKHNDIPTYSAWMTLGVCINPLTNTNFFWRRQWVGPYQHTQGGGTDAGGFYYPVNELVMNKRIVNSEAWGGAKKGGGYGAWGSTSHKANFFFRSGESDQTEVAAGRIQQWAHSGFGDGVPQWDPISGDPVDDINDAQELNTLSYPDSHYGGMPGIAHVYVRDWLLGEGTAIPGISFEVTVTPDFTGTIESRVNYYLDGDANPAAVLYQILTNTFTGLGLPTASINTASFNQAAVICNAEGNGFSAVFSSDHTAQRLLDIVLKQIEGVIYIDPDDLQIHLDLVRDNYGAYPYAGLATFDDSNVQEVLEFKLTSWEDTYNEVRLEYEDRTTEYETRFAIQQSGNGSEKIKSISVKYPGIKTPQLANAICARELSFHATPQLIVNLKMNREASSLRPAGVFKWTCDEYGITDMVLRVIKVDLGDPGDNSVIVHCHQDKYAAIPAVFSDPDRGWGDDFGIKPAAPDCYVVQEVPDNPFFGGGSWQKPLFGGFVTLAGTGNSNSGSGPAVNALDVTLNTDLILGAYEEPTDSGDNLGAECGVVSTAYTSTARYYDVSGAGLEVSGLSTESVLRNNSESEIRSGKAVLLIGNEYMSYESFTNLTPPTYRSSAQAETAVAQTDIVITAPAGVAEGDLLIAIINFGSTAFDTAPDGWSHVFGSPYTNELGATDNVMVVMTKTAGASEPADYTFSCVSAEAAEINGSIHAIENGGSVEFAKFVEHNDSHAAGVNADQYTGGVDTGCEMYITALASSGEWYTAGSLISPTAGFTEIDDLAGTTGNHLQVQYSTATAEGPVSIDLNISGVTPTTTHTLFSMGIRSKRTGNTYRLNNIWRGLFDTEAEDHDTSESVFFLSSTEMPRKTARRAVICEEETLIRSTISSARQFYTESVPPVLAAMVTERRDQRPLRPTLFVLRDDGPDAFYSGPEFDYAYNDSDPKQVVNASVVGADAKVSSTGTYGDVWTNDLRGTWNRRPKVVDCGAAIVRGDDDDAPYGEKETTSLRVQAKGDQESSWVDITSKDVQGNPINQNTNFINMSKVVQGPGSVRLAAFNVAPLSGDELMSHTAESVSIVAHTCRQLLINPNFRPFWDVYSDSSVASAKGEVLPGNPVYSARGWRNVTSGSGRPRYKVMDATIHQGADTAGFALTGEFVAGEYVTVEQVVAVPYLDTEGSDVYLSWWIQADLADETEYYSVTIDTLDVNGVVLDTVNVTDTIAVVTASWSKYDLTLAAISTSVRSIRVTMGVRNTTTGSPALCKASLVMGRDIAVNQLTNPNFNTPLTGWTTTGAAFTAELAPLYGGGINPVDAAFSRFAQAGATDGDLYQDVAIPAEFGTGDYVRLQWWTANTATPGYGFVVLSTRDGVSAEVDSITVGGTPHPVLDQWYYHEAYLKITGGCVDVRATISYKDSGGAGQDFLCDAMDMTFIKGGQS